MTPEQVTIVILGLITPILFFLSLLFALLSVAGRLLTNEADRSSLGTALGHVCGSMGILLLSLAGFFIMRLQAGPAPAPLEPEWLDTTLRAVLGVAAIWCLIAGLFAFPYLVQRFRKRRPDTYELNQSEVFGTLAQAMPIIVSNHKGTIQHTTAEFDALVGTLPGELIGKQLEVIMPERYHAGHHHGMQRYIDTREPHIIGTVVAIDMLRNDGVEIPVYLALNTTDVGGKPWFVASIWPKPHIDPDTLPPVTPYQEGVNTRQDVREGEQNRREVHQDERSVTQDERTVTQDALQLVLDNGEVVPVVIDSAVADTIIHTDAIVEEIKHDVKDIRDCVLEEMQVNMNEMDDKITALEEDAQS